MKNVFIYIVLIGVLLAMSDMVCCANTIIGSFDWNDGTTQGWTSDESWSHLSSPGSGGVDDSGYLRIDMDPTAAAPSEGWYALTSVSASSLFTGTWRSDMWVEFDFWTENIEPECVQVRGDDQDGTWQNTVLNDNEFSMNTNIWSLSSASFRDYTDWDYGGGVQEDFVNDLSAIDWIDVYFNHNGSGGQNSGVYDFNIMMPESSEYIMSLFLYFSL